MEWRQEQDEHRMRMEWNRDMHEMEWNKDKMKCGNLYTCKYIKQARLGIQCVLSFAVLLASFIGFPCF